LQKTTAVSVDKCRPTVVKVPVSSAISDIAVLIVIAVVTRRRIRLIFETVRFTNIVLLLLLLLLLSTEMHCFVYNNLIRSEQHQFVQVFKVQCISQTTSCTSNYNPRCCSRVHRLINWAWTWQLHYCSHRLCLGPRGGEVYIQIMTLTT